MIKLLTKLPRKIYVAVSGGADSMAALDFLKNNHDVAVLHYNHGTEFGAKAEDFVRQYCYDYGFNFSIGRNEDEIPLRQSKELFWRNQRYNFFQQFTHARDIVLAHTLDDAVETWLFTSLHGNSSIIPATRDRFVRPFLLTKRVEMRDWCSRRDVPYLDDPANDDVIFPRVRLRNVIIPEALNINPGLYKVISKKYLENRL